jgi:hypothetical protein
LTSKGQETLLEWENLSPSERVAMAMIAKKFAVDVEAKRGELMLPRPLSKVQPMVARAMKPGRALLSAVVYRDGMVEEVHQGPYRTPARSGTSEIAVVKEAEAAVTVAQPTKGCPVPEFERADVRATRILRTFLSPSQLGDFDRTQSFVVTGADSARLYILTSRQAPPDRLARVEGRSVYCVDTKAAICVHDWTVPAAEELLELALFLGLPGRETYACSLPVHP